jgi:hypothetical protein
MRRAGKAGEQYRRTARSARPVYFFIFWITTESDTIVAAVRRDAETPVTQYAAVEALSGHRAATAGFP